jgi:hypothetical protein
VVGGNAALWLRLDNLSKRGGDGQPVSALRDRLELAHRLARCNVPHVALSLQPFNPLPQ